MRTSCTVALALLGAVLATAAEPGYRTVERLDHDFDGDGARDVLLLQVPEGWEGNGDFTRVRLELAGREPLQIDNEDGWVAYRDYLVGPVSEEQRRIVSDSPLQNQRVALVQVAPDQRLLLLFGYPYVSDPGRLTVLTLREPHVVFDHEFLLLRVADVDGDGRMDLVGRPQFTQQTGADPSVSAAPIEVYTLRDGALVKLGVSGTR